MRKTIFTFFALSLLAAALFSCSSGVEYVIKEKAPDAADTNKYYATSQAATKVYFYLQNKNGDPELSTYERDKASDIENASIQKGTPVSQLSSLKSYVGFTFYTASQTQNVLNLYYSRNKVKYEFYSAKEKGQLAFRFVGLYGSKVSPPDSGYTPQKNCIVVGWEDDDGNGVDSTYGPDDKKFYPRLLAKEEAVGTKGSADTKGDILLDDGSVISYKEFCDLDNDGKSKVALHAFGVLVCPSYKSDQIASSAPEDNKASFYNNNIKGKSSLLSGEKKLVAAVFKGAAHGVLPWINYNDTLLQSSMSLENYFDGAKNISLLKSASLADGDYRQGQNALAFCDSYGKNYCPSTAFADGWHLPSVGELGVFYDAFFAGDGWTALTALLYNFPPAVQTVWTSNSSAHPYDASAIYTRPAKKSWAFDFTNMKTLETARDTNANVIPFMIF